ncbi:tocopherol O-methyltransferase, chloroplastic-like isoform X3 [Abrus precatorius]|uniref:Tocopherol O-methyltransferase, chloroplastic-like isoform X3 n=1 Tax=Abrus precatorius TaxID=3816 RepID=A0A8B8LC29_ABRPR|nr:tocopherol O-methyltransferase, chloroplastic-like isoform X3 [Abrus precatorius]
MAMGTTNPPMSCIHTFRTQSPQLPIKNMTFSRIRVGPGYRTSIRVSAASSGMKEMVLEQHRKEEKQLQMGIAEFYDESSAIWEDIWGDHMHHGFYDPDSTVSVSDHRAAQIRMIEESLRFAGVSVQVSFQVADALEQPFPDGQFDLVWSMESGEHMPDKAKFVGELARVAAPGGTIIIVTWCHRDLGPAEDSLHPWEKDLLKRICDAYYLPAWSSTSDYIRLLQSLSLQDIKTADWSPFVAPFWPAVIRSALTWKGLTSLFRSGLKTIKGALAMPLMIEGFKKDLIKFAIITCRKPK